MAIERDGNFGVHQGPGRDSPRRPKAPAPRREGESRPSFGRLFARWDDPLTWSVSVASWCGYRVGIHWITVFWVALQIMLAIPVDRIGPQNIAMIVTSVMLIVAVRESVRLWIARRVGGEPEYVVIWPLGTLLGPTPPRSVAPKLLIYLTPTLVSLAIGVTLAFTLAMMGATSRQILFNPFNVRAVVRDIGPPWMAIIWSVYFANLCVGALNLLPMVPLDGGRLIEAWAWLTRRSQARRLVGLLALVVAGLLTITGISAEQPILIAIAVFGGLAGWLELRRSEFVDQPVYVSPSISPALPPDWIVGAADRPAPEEFGEHTPEQHSSIPDFPIDLTETLPSPHHAREPASEPPLGAEIEAETELDGILAKISATGLASLTDEEREALARATRRLKGE